MIQTQTPYCGAEETNPSSIHEDAGSIPGLGIWCYCKLVCGLAPALLWLWQRLAPVAPIRFLAWELPYAVDVALKKKKIQTL